MPKVMPKYVFVEHVVLFILHHLVLLHINGGEDLDEEATGIALCQEQQPNGCKMAALSSSVNVDIAIYKNFTALCTACALIVQTANRVQTANKEQSITTTPSMEGCCNAAACLNHTLQPLNGDGPGK